MSRSKSDLIVAYLTSALGSGVVADTSQPTAGSGTVIQPRGDDSLTNYTATTAAGAGATLASLTTPPSGLYDVRVSIRITTGANASLADNIEILQTAAVKRRVVHQAVGATTTVLLPEYTQEFRVDGSQNILVRASGAEAAAVVYAVSLWARKVAD